MEKILSSEYQNLMEVSKEYKDTYLGASPFPYIKFKTFFCDSFLNTVLNEFPDLSKENSTQFDNSNERKFAGKGEASFGVKTRSLMHFLNSEPFLEFIQSITGIEEKLLGDPYFIGGGLHEIKRDGLLKIHADFNKHKLTGLDRRVNVLIYLNKNWEEQYGGHFELWDADMTECRERILPAFNTLVIFTTTDFSYHGHPTPLNCPDDMSRKSLALYYYSNGRPRSELNPTTGDHSTLFRETDPNSKPTNNLLNKTQLILKNIAPPIITKVASKVKAHLKA